MRIGLTGASGFLGRHIVDQLVQQGHDLRALVRDPARAETLRASGVELIRGDLDESAALARLVAGAETVVHAAAWSEGSFQRTGQDQAEEHFQKNVLGSLRLLELAREACRQFVFISSGAVYGEPPGHAPLTEDFARRPATLYGAYKASVEMFCQAYAVQLGFNACALRPFPILGLHEPPQRSPHYDLVRRVLAGGVVQVAKGHKYVLAEDVARAVALVCGEQQTRGEVYNLCEGFVTEQRIAEVAAELGPAAARITSTGPAAPQHEAPSEPIARLGMRFSGIQGLRRFVEQLVRAARNQATPP